MKPEKRRSLLVENNVKQIEIARDLKVSSVAVTRVIKGEFASKRIRAAIAAKAGVTFEKMWGAVA